MQMCTNEKRCSAVNRRMDEWTSLEHIDLSSVTTSEAELATAADPGNRCVIQARILLDAANHCGLACGGILCWHVGAFWVGMWEHSVYAQPSDQCVRQGSTRDRMQNMSVLQNRTQRMRDRTQNMSVLQNRTHRMRDSMQNMSVLQNRTQRTSDRTQTFNTQCKSSSAAR